MISFKNRIGKRWTNNSSSPPPPLPPFHSIIDDSDGIHDSAVASRCLLLRNELEFKFNAFKNNKTLL